jgi:UTP-glucose-1-phosphate uridylyltransferase
MKTSLVIMAAGIGSRFGGGVKQLEPVGLHNELIIDYSIHDAIEAGFNKIIFIIRKDIEKDFREVIGERIEALCGRLGIEVCYAFQSLTDVPAGVTVPAGRTKPWGTGQAVLAAKALIHEPFAVINADDYYGKAAFRIVHDFLLGYDAQRPNDFCMAGFLLKNTLSDNGGVTRGLCKLDSTGYLTDVVETKNIIKTASGAQADGVAIDGNTYASMNMWGLTPEFLDTLEVGFGQFFQTLGEDELKGEYLLPIYIGQLLREHKVTVKALETDDKWFGVTYKEDKPLVVESFRALIAQGVYHESLFEDIG